MSAVIVAAILTFVWRLPAWCCNWLEFGAKLRAFRNGS